MRCLSLTLGWMSNFRACTGTPEYHPSPISVTTRHVFSLLSLRDMDSNGVFHSTISRDSKSVVERVRCEDILRKHESVPTPRSLFERKKKRFVFPAGSRCFMSNLFLCSANCVFQKHQFYTCAENFHRYFSVLMIFQILKRAGATRKRAKGRGERRLDKLRLTLVMGLYVT